MDATTPRGFYTRQYLPHFDGGAIPQFVTFHLADCFSTELLQRWEEKLAYLPPEQQRQKRAQLVDYYLDEGTGNAWLRDPYLAGLVEDALCYFHGERYVLHAWVVMPNHAHTLLTPFSGFRLEKITHSWKSYTAHAAMKYSQRQETFWYPESYDRFMRDDRHFANTLSYIEMNPVKAGLCRTPEDWRWSSAWWRAQAEQ
jgi:REP element-mobilizing transposase RayT